MTDQMADPAVVDAWLTILCARGLLHSAEPVGRSGWAVQRTPDSSPCFLTTPAEASRFIASVQRGQRR
ncbi:hypothetical protein [Streptomyces sp. NPDC127098]|uniref:hypothetical protein n=1 Tax=Streptomyces sp. NPDC127098 TaxID=3347137 RepID=UPI00366813D2